MNKVKFFQSKDFKNIPWKNGAGETQELFKIKHSGKEDFLFRLSIATLSQSGPFSLYSNIDRILVLIEGDEITLTPKNTQPQILHKWEVFKFKGEIKINCELKSPGKDFNLMINRDFGKAELNVLHLKAGLKISLVSGDFLYQCSGKLSLDERLIPEETLWELESAVEIESLTDSTSLHIKLTSIDKRYKAF